MKRLLVIDDDDPSREKLVRALRASGYDIAGEAASGRAALALVQTSAPDALLMAVGLRDIEGIDAARDLIFRTPVALVVRLPPGMTIDTREAHFVATCFASIRSHARLVSWCLETRLV